MKYLIVLFFLTIPLVTAHNPEIVSYSLDITNFPEIEVKVKSLRGPDINFFNENIENFDVYVDGVECAQEGYFYSCIKGKHITVQNNIVYPEMEEISLNSYYEIIQDSKPIMNSYKVDYVIKTKEEKVPKITGNVVSEEQTNNSRFPYLIVSFITMFLGLFLFLNKK